jgi:23S rRNA pseudouridine2457 synthase
VLSQFTDDAGRPTLAAYIDTPGVYAAGRLDADSEGLLVLTDVPWVKARLADPARAIAKTYWAEVELDPEVDLTTALDALRAGPVLADGPTHPLGVRLLDPQAAGGPHAAPGLARLPPRHPPVSPRPGRTTGWIEVALAEGRNRQVRRMCAAVGLPALRLVRIALGPWRLEGIGPGKSREIPGLPAFLFAGGAARSTAPAGETKASGRRGRPRPPRRPTRRG